MQPEPRGNPEGQYWSKRNKVGLEIPLEGRLWGERRLTFAPPLWHDVLTIGCIIFGLYQTLGQFVHFLPFVLPLLWFGPAIFLSGIWAQLSYERMTIDLKTQTYARREGHGIFKRIIRGNVSELDALVVTTQAQPMNRFVYRAVLHWKGGRQPLLVVETSEIILPTGQPMQVGAHDILTKSSRWARLINVPFYDNSYFHSPGPVKPF
ncbi:MAG: hypothetical protein R2688_01775 [Fimbriimonadaceae bacterium]